MQHTPALCRSADCMAIQVRYREWCIYGMEQNIPQELIHLFQVADRRRRRVQRQCE